METSRREFMRRLARGTLFAGAVSPAIGLHDALSQPLEVVPRRSPPIPPAPLRLPFRIPDPGTFAEFTRNRPADVGMGPGTLANWCGGTFISSYGLRGGVAYHGGREHSQITTNSQQAVYVLDCNSGLYVRRCFPTQTNTQGLFTGTPLAYSGTPTDQWGAYTDGSAGAMHTYAGLCEMPAAWNEGTPAMVRVFQSAGASAALLGESYAATWRFDLSKANHSLAEPSMTRLTGDQTYHQFANRPADVAVVSDAPTACIDTIREGWWAFSRTSSGNRGVSFTHRLGAITNFAAPGLALARWSKMHHFSDDDILCVMCDEPAFGVTRFGVVKLLAMDQLPGGSWITVLPTLPPSPSPLISCGYGGPQWSSMLGCFVMLDTNFDGGAQCRVWKLIPPPPGQRLTGEWAWSHEIVTSADGSTIAKTDHASVNGAWGRLVECPALRAFVWTRSIDRKGQLIRLAGMI